VLGVQRAGAAYVPIDPDGPASRSREMLDDAEIDVVIVDERTARAAAFAGRRLLAVPATDTTGTDGADDGDDGDPGPAGPAHAAYVLYTSGSTGGPRAPGQPPQRVEFCAVFSQQAGADRRSGRSLRRVHLGRVDR
jgi:non-ribosomal peptide synthetase component F